MTDEDINPGLEIAKLRAEIERLRAQLASLNQPVKLSEWQELQTERNYFRAILANVYDNLSDLPISKDWARATCFRIADALDEKV